MVSKKKSISRKTVRTGKSISKRAKRFNHRATPAVSTQQSAHDQLNGHNGTVPLRTQTAHALQNYFSHLNGDHPRHLYEMVLREVEEPLFRTVLDYVKGNQSRAAEVLGLNRGTLRKKLREHGLAEAD
jgi:Fis family transcriptional regulator, factor for inversion stimulation protein